MVKLTLEGPQPFDLVAASQPVITASYGTVTMTLAVYDPRLPENVVHIQLPMTPEEAEYISSHLVPAITTARMQIRYPSKF